MRTVCPSLPVPFSSFASISPFLLLFVPFIGIWIWRLKLKREIDRVNGIDFEEIKVELSKRQQLSPEFQGNTNQCVCKHCTALHLSKNFHGKHFHSIAHLQLSSIFLQRLTLSRKYLLLLTEGSSYLRGTSILFSIVLLVSWVSYPVSYIS